MSDWNPKANEIFLAAVEIEDPAERDAFIAKQCRGNEGLQREVGALLSDAANAGSFLDRPAIEEESSFGNHAAPTNTFDADVGGVVSSSSDRSKANESAAKGISASSYIGPYKLLQRIGEGGMGEVWMAEQTQPVRRRVALKVIKQGLDTRQVIARFEAERQALAMMDHQNIARVLDAGTTPDGQPFFVMELVNGIPLTKYCDTNKLSLAERLALFIPVCQAIQHAHQKGIVHRDLKPSNVLVTLYDGKPVPKVIDFGLAKALQHQQKLTDKTLFTEFGQVVGTLQYMSPEQAEMNALDIDTRTDVYSLGVMLYELLTGSTPIEKETLQKEAVFKVLETIREKDPPRPSARLSSSGEAITGISEQRRIDPRRLQSILRGDLDWIVMKALEKDRTRRYETANGFAEDVSRYLTGDAIQARPPSTHYRIQKFVKKNQGLVTASATILFLLTTAIVGTTFGFAWALREKTRADNKASDAMNAATKAKAAEEVAKEKGIEAQLSAQKAKDSEVRALLEKQEAERQRSLAEKAEQHSAELLYLNTIKLVETEFEFGDPTLGWRALKTCRWDLRGWEHDYLFTRFTQNLETFGKAESDILFMALSPDGKSICSEDFFGSWNLWNLDTRKIVRHLDPPSNKRFGSAAFSADSKRLVTTAGGQIMCLWDLNSGERLWTIEASGLLEDVAFSPDSKQILCGYGDAIGIYDAETGKEVHTIRDQEMNAHSIVFFANGEKAKCAAASAETIIIWDIESRKLTHRFVGHAANVTCVAISPDASQIISGSEDGTIKVWDSLNGTLIQNLVGHKAQVECLSYAPNGKELVSGSLDQTLKIWNLESGTALHTFRSNIGPIMQAFYSPDSQVIFSRSLGGKTIDMWSLSGEKNRVELKEKGRFAPVMFSPDLTLLALLGPSSSNSNVPRSVQLYNTKTGIVEFTFDGPDRFQYSITRIAFSPDSAQIAVYGNDGSIRIWNAVSGKELLTIQGSGDYSGYDASLSFSGDSTKIAAEVRSQIRIWDATSGTELATIPRVSGFSNIAFSPDSKTIVGGGLMDLPNRIPCLNATTGKLEYSFAIPEDVNVHGSFDDFTFSPDGRYVMAIGDFRNVVVWSVETHDVVATFQGHSDSVYCASFSPDGKRIVSSGSDRTIRVWKAHSGEQVLSLQGHKAPVMDAAFSPDSQKIISVDASGVVMFWNAERREELPVEMAQDMNQRAWSFVRTSGGRPHDIDAALRESEAACKFFPTGVNLNTLGVIQFRLGKFDESIATLCKSVPLHQRELNLPSPHPAELAFLAMSHFKLGNFEDANEFRTQFNQAMKLEQLQFDPDCIAFRAEVDELFDSPVLSENR